MAALIKKPVATIGASAGDLTLGFRSILWFLFIFLLHLSIYRIYLFIIIFYHHYIFTAWREFLFQIFFNNP